MAARRKFRRWAALWDSAAFSALLGIGLAVALIHMVNGRIRPMMVELAAARVNNEVVLLLGEEVEANPLSYDDVVTLEKDAEGHITALKSDMNAVNAYRAKLLAGLVDGVDQLKHHDMSIPLGSLTGVDLLSGRGPGVPVKVLSVGAAKSSFENVFTAAGINQTRHQIMLHVTATISILLPGATTQTDVDAQMCVAETVIVGAVPENFTYFSQFDTAKEAADHYFDYGAGQ